MKAAEFRAIRERLGMNRDQLAEVLGLSGYKAIANIELGIRNPSRLTAMVLKILDSLPRKRTEELIELLRRFRE